MHSPRAAEDDHLLRSIPAARVALIERIRRAAPGLGRRNELRQRFLGNYFHGVAEEDLAERAPRQLARAALAHLEFGTQRPAGRSLVRVFNPQLKTDGFESPHTLVLTVTEDMPFLVDSLGMAFGRAELAVHLIVHPVLQVRRDRRGHLLDIGTNGAHATHRESWQLYEIDRVTDPQVLTGLQRDLETTLADVRLAVTDWRAMRERAREIIRRLESDPPPLPPEEVSEAAHLLDWMEAQHFVFLGYRHYRLERGRSEDRLVPDVRSGLGILREVRSRGGRPRVSVLRGDVRTRARGPELLILTKANSTATV
ncbi:MAG: NAD-glutamate dehydrogenase, partial [Gammaproteobacteria bacterium]|nr:NAD-glutamate dehydrogenase [Gammaproteobacteria bacterium]